MAAPQATTFRSLALMLRGRARMTQRDLANAIGVSERAIQIWEAGLGYPSAASLQRLIASYVDHTAFSPGREVDEATDLWAAALVEAPRLKTAFDTEWFSTLLARKLERATATNGVSSGSYSKGRQDWGEAPAVDQFHGRISEQQLLSQWLLQEDCRVVGVFGMGGIGKTALVARVAGALAGNFETVFWRTLRNAPPCSEWLADAILFLTQRHSVPPRTEAARRQRLLEILRERRTLLVLDNLETVLEAGVSPLRYRDEYAGYGELLQAACESPHQSCLIVTSREEPPEVGRVGVSSGPVRLLRLRGLDELAARALLADRGLVGDSDAWSALVGRYCGNALALQVVGELISRVFNGEIVAFLSAAEAVFGDIRRLLRAHVERLSATERSVLNWLAIEREPVDFQTLADDLGPGTPRHELLDALQTLDRRSLLELGEREATFTLQPVVLEHATEEIVSRAASEIVDRAPALLLTHTLVKSDSKEYVRRSQKRLIAQPMLERLQVSISEPDIEQSLLDLLDRWRCLPHNEQGYGPANVITLLRLTRGTLRGLNLSQLYLRQAELWDVSAQDLNLSESYLERATVSQQFGAATSTRLSEDGSSLAVGTLAGEVRLWRMSDRTPVLLEKQSGPAWDLGLSSDGKTVASCGGNHGVNIWRTGASGRQRALHSRSPSLWCVALSSDGRVAVGGSGDGTALIWDATSGTQLREFACHSGGVRGVALSHDGRLLASGGADGTVAVWSLDGGVEQINRRTFPGDARAVAITPDGRLIANGDGDGLIHVWNPLSGETRMVLTGHTGPIWAVAVSADGGLIATGGADQTVRVWDTQTGDCRQVLHEHTAGVMCASLSGDGEFTSSVALDGTLRVWETATGRCLIATSGNVPAVFEAALSPDGSWAVSGGSDGQVRVWDVDAGCCTRTLSGHSAAVWGVALSRRGDLAVSGSMDATLRVWSIPSGECRLILSGHTLGVCGVTINEDRGLIASASFDGTVRVWDSVSGECLRVHRCSVGGVRTVRFSGDGERLFSGDLDGTVRVWTTRTGDLLQSISGSCELRALATTWDGRVVAVAQADGDVTIWDVDSAEQMRIVQTQPLGPRTIALSTDGKTLVSGGVDGTVQVWDIQQGILRRELAAHTSEVWGTALSADQRVAITGGLDGTVRVWDLETGIERKTLRPDRPYERMDITGVGGLSDIQRDAILALGAVISPA